MNIFDDYTRNLLNELHKKALFIEERFLFLENIFIIQQLSLPNQQPLAR